MNTYITNLSVLSDRYGTIIRDFEETKAFVINRVGHRMTPENIFYHRRNHLSNWSHSTTATNCTIDNMFLRNNLFAVNTQIRCGVYFELSFPTLMTDYISCLVCLQRTHDQAMQLESTYKKVFVHRHDYLQPICCVCSQSVHIMMQRSQIPMGCVLDRNGEGNDPERAPIQSNWVSSTDENDVYDATTSEGETSSED